MVGTRAATHSGARRSRSATSPDFHPGGPPRHSGVLCASSRHPRSPDAWSGGDHAEGDAERKDRPSAFNRPDEEFLAVFGDSRTGESEGGCLQQDDQDPKDRKQPFDPAAESEHLLLELDEALVGNVESDDVGTLGLEPAPSGGAWNASAGRVGDISRRTNEFTKAMVIAALSACCGLHAPIIVASSPVSTRH